MVMGVANNYRYTKAMGNTVGIIWLLFILGCTVYTVATVYF
jgi:hypothetical protein